MFHVIDDNEIVVEVIKIIFSDAAHDVRCFGSGDQYLEYFNSNEYKKPVAIIADVTMPGTNGYDLVLTIRQQYPRLKIALLTGNTNPKEQGKSAIKQLCNFISKPDFYENLKLFITSATACESAHMANTEKKYLKRCEFGINHDCPLYILKQVN